MLSKLWVVGVCGVLLAACSTPAPAPPPPVPVIPEEPPPCAAAKCLSKCVADCKSISANRCLPAGTVCETSCEQASARKQYDFSTCIAELGSLALTACKGSDCYFGLFPATTPVPPTLRDRDRCGGICTDMNSKNCLKADDLARCNGTCGSVVLRSKVDTFVTCWDDSKSDCGLGKGCLASFIVP